MDSALKFQSDDFGKLILRLVVGGLMLFHGVAKILHGIAWMPPMLTQVGLPGFVAYGVYVGEVVAPLLIIAGWQTRLSSLIVAFDMVMAVWLAHSKSIFTVNPGSGGWSIELEAFYLFAALALSFLGSGKLSLSKGRKPWN